MMCQVFRAWQQQQPGSSQAAATAAVAAAAAAASSLSSFSCCFCCICHLTSSQGSSSQTSPTSRTSQTLPPSSLAPSLSNEDSPPDATPHASLSYIRYDQTLGLPPWPRRSHE